MDVKSKANYRIIRKVLLTLSVIIIALLTSCSKKSGYALPPTAVKSVIQINVNSNNYSLASAPDAISFSQLAANTATLNLFQYSIKGKSSTSAVMFTLNFHNDITAAGYYIMDSSTLVVNSKTYLSIAKNSTDKIVVTKLDNGSLSDGSNIYEGTFSFYSYNKALATDSVLITGIYSIQ